MTDRTIIIANSTKTPFGWERDEQTHHIGGLSPNNDGYNNLVVLNFSCDRCAYKDHELRCFHSATCFNKVIKPGRIMSKKLICDCTEFVYFMSFPFCKEHESEATKIKKYMMDKMVEMDPKYPMRPKTYDNKDMRRNILKSMKYSFDTN